MIVFMHPNDPRDANEEIWGFLITIAAPTS